VLYRLGAPHVLHVLPGMLLIALVLVLAGATLLR